MYKIGDKVWHEYYGECEVKEWLEIPDCDITTFRPDNVKILLENGQYRTTHTDCLYPTKLLSKEEQVLDLFTRLLTLEDFTYNDINSYIEFRNPDKLHELEKTDSRLGLAQIGSQWNYVSTLSLLATVTDILIGKRLAFCFATNDDGSVGRFIRCEWR